MAIVNQQQKTDIKVSGGDDAIVYRIYPEIYRHINYVQKMVQVEVVLPGVKKEDILLKTLPEWFHLSAKRPADGMEFSADYNYGVEIVPEKTTAEYFNGLLKIRAVISDPLEKAKEVKL